MIDHQPLCCVYFIVNNHRAEIDSVSEVANRNCYVPSDSSWIYLVYLDFLSLHTKSEFAAIYGHICLFFIILANA